MEYGKILRKLRKERNMSQEEVALFAGVGKSQISKYERGENSPTLDIAVLIAKCLGVSVDEMVDGNGEAPKNIVIFSKQNGAHKYFEPCRKIAKRMLVVAVIFQAIWALILTGA